jgi:tetrahydromethanopterin S-methyltransferase subunit F
MAEWKNILPDDQPISEEVLLRYAAGKATPEEIHAIERQMADLPMMDDAMEGLQQLGDTQKIASTVQEINARLQFETRAKKTPRTKKPIQNEGWIIQAVVILLLLSILAYWVIHTYYKK